MAPSRTTGSALTSQLRALWKQTERTILKNWHWTSSSFHPFIPFFGEAAAAAAAAAEKVMSAMMMSLQLSWRITKMSSSCLFVCVSLLENSLFLSFFLGSYYVMSSLSLLFFGDFSFFLSFFFLSFFLSFFPWYQYVAHYLIWLRLKMIYPKCVILRYSRILLMT